MELHSKLKEGDFREACTIAKTISDMSSARKFLQNCMSQACKLDPSATDLMHIIETVESLIPIILIDLDCSNLVGPLRCLYHLLKVLVDKQLIHKAIVCSQHMWHFMEFMLNRSQNEFEPEDIKSLKSIAQNTYIMLWNCAIKFQQAEKNLQASTSQQFQLDLFKAALKYYSFYLKKEEGYHIPAKIIQILASLMKDPSTSTNILLNLFRNFTQNLLIFIHHNNVNHQTSCGYLLSMLLIWIRRIYSNNKYINWEEELFPIELDIFSSKLLSYSTPEGDKMAVFKGTSTCQHLIHACFSLLKLNYKFTKLHKPDHFIIPKDFGQGLSKDILHQLKSFVAWTVCEKSKSLTGMAIQDCVLIKDLILWYLDKPPSLPICGTYKGEIKDETAVELDNTSKILKAYLSILFYTVQNPKGGKIDVMLNQLMKDIIPVYEKGILILDVSRKSLVLKDVNLVANACLKKNMYQAAIFLGEFFFKSIYQLMEIHASKNVLHSDVIMKSLNCYLASLRTKGDFEKALKVCSLAVVKLNDSMHNWLLVKSAVNEAHVVLDKKKRSFKDLLEAQKVILPDSEICVLLLREIMEYRKYGSMFKEDIEIAAHQLLALSQEPLYRGLAGLSICLDMEYTLNYSNLCQFSIEYLKDWLSMKQHSLPIGLEIITVKLNLAYGYYTLYRIKCAALRNALMKDLSKSPTQAKLVPRGDEEEDEDSDINPYQKHINLATEVDSLEPLNHFVNTIEEIHQSSNSWYSSLPKHDVSKLLFRLRDSIEKFNLSQRPMQALKLGYILLELTFSKTPTSYWIEDSLGIVSLITRCGFPELTMKILEKIKIQAAHLNSPLISKTISLRKLEAFLLNDEVNIKVIDHDVELMFEFALEVANDVNFSSQLRKAEALLLLSRFSRFYKVPGRICPILLAKESLDISQKLLKDIGIRTQKEVPVSCGYFATLGLLLDGVHEVGVRFAEVGASNEASMILKSYLLSTQEALTIVKSAKFLHKLASLEYLGDMKEDCLVKLDGILHILTFQEVLSFETESIPILNSSNENDPFTLNDLNKMSTNKDNKFLSSSPESYSSSYLNKKPPSLCHSSDCFCFSCQCVDVNVIYLDVLILEAILHFSGSVKELALVFKKFEELRKLSELKRKILDKNLLSNFSKLSQIFNVQTTSVSSSCSLLPFFKYKLRLHQYLAKFYLDNQCFTSGLHEVDLALEEFKKLKEKNKLMLSDVKASLLYVKCQIELHLLASIKNIQISELFDFYCGTNHAVNFLSNDTQYLILTPEKESTRMKSDSILKRAPRRKCIQTNVLDMINYTEPDENVSNVATAQKTHRVLQDKLQVLSTKQETPTKISKTSNKEETKRLYPNSETKCSVPQTRTTRSKAKYPAPAEVLRSDDPEEITFKPRTRRAEGSTKVTKNDRQRLGSLNKAKIEIYEDNKENSMPSKPVTPCYTRTTLPDVDFKVIEKTLEEALALIIHHPPGTLFSDINLLLTLIYCHNKKSIWKQFSKFSDCVSISLRHLWESNLTKLALSDPSLEIKKGIDFSLDLKNLSLIPNEWTVVQVCTLNQSLASLTSTTPDLLISRYTSNNDPVLVLLTAKDEQLKRSFLKELDNIMDLSYRSLKTTDRNTWWTQRKDGNSRLKQLCNSLQDAWLGCWKTLFLGQCQDLDRGNKVKEICQKLLKKAEEMNLACSDSKLLEIIVANGFPMTENQLSTAVSTLWSTNSNYKSYCKLTKLFKDEIQSLGISETPRQPVILILDKYLHSLPWESMPILQGSAVYRFPSLPLLLTQLKRGEVNRNAEKLYHIVNPGGDLINTQEKMIEFTKKVPKWKGTFGTVQSISQEMIRGITQYDYFLYCGHGSGHIYLNKELIELKPCRAAVILMGCSSGKLKQFGSLDPFGIVLKYLMGGSPLVVCNLWDVTDKDIDRFTECLLLNWLFKDGKKMKSFGTALADARKICHLEYLVGSAPVVYGLPLNVTSYLKI